MRGKAGFPRPGPRYDEGASAGPVFRLLGKKDLGTAAFPEVEAGLMDGDPAWRQHKGGHATGPNWPTFLTWADRCIHGPAR